MAKATELEYLLPTIDAEELRAKALQDESAYQAADELLNSRGHRAFDVAYKHNIPARNLAVTNSRYFSQVPGGAASPIAETLADIGLERAAATGTNSITLVLMGHGSAVPRVYDDRGFVRPEVAKLYPVGGETTNVHVPAHMAAEGCEAGCGGGQGRTDLVRERIDQTAQSIVDKKLRQTGENTFVLQGDRKVSVKIVKGLSITGILRPDARSRWNAFDRDWTRQGTKFLVAEGLNSLPDPETAKRSEYLSKIDLDTKLQVALLNPVTGVGCFDVRQELMGRNDVSFDTEALIQKVVEARSFWNKWIMMQGETYASNNFETWMHSEAPKLNIVNITSAKDPEDPKLLQQIIAASKYPQALVNHAITTGMRSGGTRRGYGKRTVSEAHQTAMTLPSDIVSDPRYAKELAFLVGQTTDLLQMLDKGGYRWESSLDPHFGSLQSEWVVNLNGQMVRVGYGQGLQLDVPNNALGKAVLESIRPAEADSLTHSAEDQWNPNPRHTAKPGTERALGLQLS